MSFFDMLGTVLLGPLKLVFELIYGSALVYVSNPGVAIIFLSLVMNVLVLPLYRRADAMQEEARDTEARLRDGVAHIKKTFSGDERMMILQTYYRQNGYKPTSGLKGSVSLLLEIPFFMAAYQFLSSLSILDGIAFGPIADLGKPDGLLVIGGLSINVLPVLMTLINFVSSYLYLKGFPLKTKIQLYAMALFFLVFLYTSPSCLVFYWTLNNLFSLVKTILYKLKNPMAVIRVLTTVAGAFLMVYSFIFNDGIIGNSVALFLIGFALEIPLFAYMLTPKNPPVKKQSKVQNEYFPNRKLFFLGSLFLTVLIGALIPSAYIAASPQEYVDMGYFHNPLWYIASTFCFAAGTFMVWVRVFYWLASSKGKVLFERVLWALCGVALVNYMFFGTNLGVINSALKYEGGMRFSIPEYVWNVIAIIMVVVLMCLVMLKWKKTVPAVLAVATLAIGGMSGMNVAGIKGDVDDIYKSGYNGTVELPTYTLSKNGKNVVVIMLDRAMGQYVPFMFNERSELTEKFAGFTYYDNVISFGGSTNFGVPALLGGYEYTPVEMNRRDEESLVSKHNEALKLMPTVFADSGYRVSMYDPTYANYSWIPDLSIFDDRDDIRAEITKGKFGDIEQKKAVVSNNHRNFFLFSLMKTLPVSVQGGVYGKGSYNQLVYSDGVVHYGSQTTVNTAVSEGLSSSFMDPYNVLVNMPYVTMISDSDENTFMYLANDTCHEPMLLQTPDYVPSEKVDNTLYEAENAGRFELNGIKLKVDTETQMIHYHANMAAFIRLGDWFDHLRKEGVYDNTRIIVVSDHGRDLGQIEQFVMGGSDKQKDTEGYFPLLMVKDFGSTQFTTSHEFMTNADVPTLAMAGLIDNPVNPFTGKVINNSEKTAHEQFVILSDEWNTKENNGNTFKASKWVSVKDNIWDKSNWTFYSKKTVLKENEAPQ